jgi:hypothetical protein
MGFGLWIDKRRRLAWAQGAHEYRPMGVAVISATDVFRPRDFDRRRSRPAELRGSFVGFFGSLEEVNHYLQARRTRKLRQTPYYVR